MAVAEIIKAIASILWPICAFLCVYLLVRGEDEKGSAPEDSSSLKELHDDVTKLKSQVNAMTLKEGMRM